MAQDLQYLRESASQTAGPFVHIGLAPAAAGFDIYREELGATMVGANCAGERIRVEGRVIDGTGNVVKDVLLEVWQADAAGVYACHGQADEVADGFRGWCRVVPDFDSGEWALDTIKPGAVIGRNGQPMAPHINLWIVARGINIGLNTRIYFADEQDANAVDPILNVIEWESRRATLIAKRSGDTYHFDICLQGDDETVFFDI